MNLEHLRSLLKQANHCPVGPSCQELRNALPAVFARLEAAEELAKVANVTTASLSPERLNQAREVYYKAGGGE